jgi:hypothetical protein
MLVGLVQQRCDSSDKPVSNRVKTMKAIAPESVSKSTLGIVRGIEKTVDGNFQLLILGAGQTTLADMDQINVLVRGQDNDIPVSLYVKGLTVSIHSHVT